MSKNHPVASGMKTISMFRNIILFLAVFPVVTLAQVADTIHKGDTTIIKDKTTGQVQVFAYVEQMPEAPYDIRIYLSKNMVFPEDAKRDGVSGRLNVKFIVKADGNIDSAHVIKKLYPSCDKEALRLINLMPPWKPGKQNGRAVNVWFILPVIFNPE